MKRLLALGSVAIFSTIGVATSANAISSFVINDYATALAQIDSTLTDDLPGGASWVASPNYVTPPPNWDPGDYRSPFQVAAGLVDANGVAYDGNEPFWSVQINVGANPAILDLGSDSYVFSLLWGSPDSYNRLELSNSVSGFSQSWTATDLGLDVEALEASFVTFKVDSLLEAFDTVTFYTGNINAFEFANLSVAPIPLPAGGLLLLSGLAGFAIRRRRKAA